MLLANKHERTGSGGCSPVTGGRVHPPLVVAGLLTSHHSAHVLYNGYMYLR